MASRQDRLRVSAAVLGAVAVLAVVGRISPEEPASQPRPTLATMRAPPQGSVRPNRWMTAQIDVGHGGGPLLLGAGTLWVGAWRDREVVQIVRAPTGSSAGSRSADRIRPAWRLMQRRSGWSIPTPMR